ncbi:MAG: ABC transporter ATP-binding protein [Rhodobacteraceae bacterium]|nr:ABC transporter ATP-binding protein [Paracoccaceae bacterium]
MSIDLKGVVKRVGAETHIYETDLTFSPGGFNVLLGATGAGKTTLIKLMAGLENPTEGSVFLNGRHVTRVSPQKRNVSLVHQFFVNYPHFSVYDNIASPLRLAGITRAEIDRRVRETAELMRLTPMLKRRPGELSGGQQQRTALARAIVKDSDLVLLDEPLANLDYKLREELRNELPRLFADRGATVIYATSEPHEALLLGGTTAAMRDGRIAQLGPTAEIYRGPNTLDTAQVFSDPPMNTARVEKRGKEVHLAPGVSWPAAGPIAAASDGVYTFGVRPNLVSPQEEAAAGVKIEGEVLITELSGSESVAHFALTATETPDPWVSQSHGVHPYEIGERRPFFINVSRGLYFDAAGARIAG